MNDMREALQRQVIWNRLIAPLLGWELVPSRLDTFWRNLYGLRNYVWLKRRYEHQSALAGPRLIVQFADTDVEATRMIWDLAQEKRALGLGNYSSLKTIQAATLPIEKDAPNRGKLLLGVNDNELKDNSGSFTVTITKQ